MNTPTPYPLSKISKLKSSIKDYVKDSLGNHATIASMVIIEVTAVSAVVFAIIRGCSS